MKKLGIITVVAAMAVAAQADFYVNVFSTYGIYDSAGVGGIIPGVGDQAIIKIYTTAGAPADGGSLDLSLEAAGESMLAPEGIFVNTGGLYEDYAGGLLLEAGQAPYANGGNLFARIFTDKNGNGVVEAGDNFYTGHVQVMTDLVVGSPPPTPESYNLGEGLLGQAAAGVVIPEPATIGLMGLAGLGMFLARRKVRR